MPKASFVMANGTKVAIEGTSEEVSLLLQRLSSSTEVDKHSPAKEPKRTSKAASPKGPLGAIQELRSDGFFNSRRTLQDIQAKLEEGGHFYPRTSVSPALVRLVRRKDLRRMKQKDGWVYVG